MDVVGTVVEGHWLIGQDPVLEKGDDDTDSGC